MFGNKIIVVYITKNKIRVYIFSKGKTQKLESSFDSDYTYENFSSLFTKLKASIGSRFRLLLDDELLYSVTISMPKEDAEKKELIRQKAQEIIPENLEHTLWTYKEIPLQNDKSTKHIQVIAVLTSFIEHLSRAIVTSGFHIEMLEPLSYALARYTERKTEPTGIISLLTHPLLVFAQKGNVIATTTLQESIQPSHISTFFEFASREYNTAPKKIILSGNTEGITPQNLGITIPLQQQNLDPFISIASKEPLKNTNEEALNSDIQKLYTLIQYKKTHPQEPEVNEKTTHSTEDIKNNSDNTSNKKIYIQLLLIGISLTFIIGSLIWFFMNQEKPISETPLPVETTISPTITETESPTPISTPSAEVSIADYKMSILNGSGKAGVATQLSDVLKEKGYDVTNTGNADRNDYEKSEIRYKSSVPKDLKKTLDKDLENLYNFIIGDTLEDSDTSDIVIIVGKE